MKSLREIGLKITAAQREYYRYTGSSAELELRGMGASRPELAWTYRRAQQESDSKEIKQRGYSNQ
jgi:hypothetical protein